MLIHVFPICKKRANLNAGEGQKKYRHKYNLVESVEKASWKIQVLVLGV